ncbi:MAG: hypothetical protein IT167_16035 [Bryobacterales bacterium]|nr:hypothetical protein [Bryobacterales bacterium]
MAIEGAQRWRLQNPHVPGAASADDVADYAYGGYTADSLGFRNMGFREEVRRAAEHFRPEDFLLFDPVREPVPTDLPKRCKRCGSNNPRGRGTCRTCGTALQMLDPYDILLDALLTTYFGDVYGVRLGAHFGDVARWIPSLRPYPGQHGAGKASFYSVAYAITHIVYTFNGYSRYRLRKEWFPEEYRFLESHFRRNLAARDVETTGEFMDTLRSFGLSDSDDLIREGIKFLLDRQNTDGSWGNPGERDIYVRYHTTWTAIDGLMDYTWQGEQLSFPDAFQRIRDAVINRK